jgi:hypothetical protein
VNVRHEIRDAAGKLFAFHERVPLPDGDKKFTWYSADGSIGLNGLKIKDLPLFGSERLPGWLADDGDAPITLCEGEKATLAMIERGYHALGTVCGAASAPSVEVLSVLRDRHVQLFPDNDEPGRKHMAKIAEALRDIAKSVRVLTWGEQPGDDAHDFFQRGGTESQLDSLLAEAEVWKVSEPAQAEPERQRAAPLVVTAAEFLAENDDERFMSLWGDALLTEGGGYTIVSGEGGIGKTIVLVGLFISLAAGLKEFLGFALPGDPIPVLVFQAEGSRRKFRARMRTAAAGYGLDLAKLPMFFRDRTVEPNLTEEGLGRMIQESGARAVLLDPIGRFHDSEENFASDWRRAVTKPLARLTDRHGAAFVFNDHHVKPSDVRSGRYKTRGTAAKIDDCGAALRVEFAAGGRGERRLIIDRVRDGAVPEPDTVLVRLDIERCHAELAPEAPDSEEAAVLGDATAAILAQVKRRPGIESGALAKACGGNRSAHFQAREVAQRRRLIEGRRDGKKTRWYPL